MKHGATNMRKWQRRIFGTVWITYFMYYFCRYNMPFGIPQDLRNEVKDRYLNASIDFIVCLIIRDTVRRIL